MTTKRTNPSTRASLCIALALFAGGTLTGICQDAKPDAKTSQPLINLANLPADSISTFFSWERKVTPIADGLRVLAPDGGNGGVNVALKANLSAYTNWTPRLTLTVGPGNKIKTLTVQLFDAYPGDTSRRFTFRLEGLTNGQLATVVANDGAALREPDAGGDPSKILSPLDLNVLARVGITPPWGNDYVDLTISRIDLVPPDEAILKARETAHEKARVQQAREAGEKQKALDAVAKIRDDLLANGAPHPADGAQVRNVGAVAPDILGIEIQSTEYQPGAMLPYAPQPGDLIRDGSLDWKVRDGKLVQEMVAKPVLRKDVQGKLTHLGKLSCDEKWYFVDACVTGMPLETAAMDQPVAYEIQSSDDPAFAKPATPLAVYRKSKQNAPRNWASSAQAILHRVYLKLPATLKEGATYTLRFKGLNTREATIAYKHDTRVARSDAVHVTQVGYRPDDPFKRGYLSIWMGRSLTKAPGVLPSGGYPYQNIATFELIDAQSGKTVFTGRPEIGWNFEPVHEIQKANYTLTPTYWLDFSAFHTPGTYRIRVPGIGVSYPFPIADTSWEATFKTGMRGILARRSGIELGPPFLDYIHHRDRHPDDGIKFYQTECPGPGTPSSTNSEHMGDAMLRIWKATGKLNEVTGLWGGHHGAGDWTTEAGTSLAMVGELIEAFDLAGDYGKHVKLSLPKPEAENNIPDILDEALWSLAAFKRLQLPNGAVRFGYDHAWAGGKGRVSWNETQPVCVFAPDPYGCWYYVWTAAQMARLLAPYDAAQAREYGETAIKAWKWAEAQPSVTGAPADADRKNRAWLWKNGLEAKAAVALYQYTRDPAYHERFKQICEIQDDCDTNYTGGWIESMQQADATFLYARLPDDLADPALKKHALNRYILAGNVANHFMRHNAFNLATALTGMPMGDFCSFFTNPGMGLCVVRAHALTHDPRLLETVVASTGFGLGANPDNLVYTTGLGANPIRFPLIRDYIGSGQPAPAGITVFGPSDQSSGNYTLLVPASNWPPAESFGDVYGWVGANEFNLPNPLASTVCVWCYLAARP